VFQTTDLAHPGVRLLMSQGDQFVAGKIELVKRVASTDKHFEITPKQSRKIFENKGWSRVVGFHTRNVAHRVHEYLQLEAFKKYHCDGILIHPLIGPKKKGDYSAQIILKSYEMMIRNYYPETKVLLGAFQNFPRYAGPREAVFTALCRKNFGCSHFIVGRDHSGVGKYYEPDAGHRLFDQLGDIGIQPIYFNAVHYHRTLQKYVEESQDEDAEYLKISGTEGREMLIQKQVPPDWFMREDISKLIIDEMDRGEDVFLK
ncbi:MAG: sulfate adenylyltransferase, partial [Candidatus Omnitrophica bacterium]|nr:sulfate adenylyltransferase [Candidatus Omnitrophota bacterium]